MKRLTAVFTSAAVLALLLLRSAAAQIDNGLPGPQPFDMGGMILSDTMNRIRIESATGSKRRPGKQKLSAGTLRYLRRYHPDSGELPENSAKKTESKASVSTAKYSANPQVSKRTREQFLRWAGTQDPEQAAKLKAVFTKNDPIQIWSGLTAPYGLQTGNLADAFASYWVLNYCMAKGQPTIERSKVMGVRDQMRSLFSHSSSLGKATSAQKQALAETWMLQFVVEQGAFGSATKSGDTAALQRLRRAAASRFQTELNLDYAKLTLNNQGFSARN